MSAEAADLTAASISSLPWNPDNACTSGIPNTDHDMQQRSIGFVARLTGIPLDSPLEGHLLWDVALVTPGLARS